MGKKLKAILAKAKFEGEDTLTWSGQRGYTDIEILQIGRWHICAVKNLGECKVEYNKPDLLDELRSNGYNITQKTRTYNIDADSFSSMEMDTYEHESGWVFLFKGLAVNVDTWKANGVKTLCKPDLSIDDAISKWNLGDAYIDKSYSVPNDPIGKLTLKINDLRFDIWSEHYRMPGEMDDYEEWLDDLNWSYEFIKNGTDPKEYVDEIKTDLDELKTEYKERLEAATTNDNRDYYLDCIASVEAYKAVADDLILESERILGHQSPTT